jgi:nitrous oxidase accessory protein NosD
MQRNGISIYGERINISGFTIRNFVTNSLKTETINGAGIFTNSETTQHIFEGNKIENCNYGFFLDGPTFCEIDNNVIRNIKRISPKSDFYDGTGIMIYPNNIGIEANMIGVKAGNRIDSVGLYGICFGADSVLISATRSKITNNTISNAAEAAVALLEVEGMIEITKNVLKDNKVSIIMHGEHFDTWVSENIITGNKSESVVEVDKNVHGMMLYNIWKENDNKFEMDTFAAKELENNQIVITPKGGYIRSNIVKAQQDAAGKFNVEEKKVGSAINK